MVVSRRAAECYKVAGKTAALRQSGQRPAGERLRRNPCGRRHLKRQRARTRQRSLRCRAATLITDLGGGAGQFPLGGGRVRFVDQRTLDDEVTCDSFRTPTFFSCLITWKNTSDRTSAVFCEARTSGKPVITTEGSFLGREVLEEGTGWLARDRDADSWRRPFGSATSELSQWPRAVPNIIPRYRQMFHRTHLSPGFSASPMRKAETRIAVFYPWTGLPALDRGSARRVDSARAPSGRTLRRSSHHFARLPASIDARCQQCGVSLSTAFGHRTRMVESGVCGF